ncbi:MAG: M24 family metallopeptidase [Spirochaetes bacterium]|nr:M24 family metallopeptidase [Spirochaetota bacterium]
MKQVRFGVIGAGGAWSFHSNACAESPLVTFTAVYDINAKHAAKMARRYRGGDMKAFGDLGEFLKSDIDAVLIMVPHAYHEEIVERAAAAGKHVLCEKPMATSLEGCDRMIRATGEAGVRFMIAENHRFLPAHRYIHDAVQQGLIGQVTHVRAYEGVNEIAGLSQPDFWKGDPIKAGGGSLMDMGAHKFAALEWILEDRVESVTAMLAKQCINLPEKAEDNALAMVRFSKGVIAEITVSFTQVTPPFNSLEIYGTGGTILENHMWERPVRIFSHHESMGDQRQQWIEPDIEHEPFPRYYNISVKHADEHFARCIQEKRDPEFTPEDAKSAIAGVLMGYLSAHTGKAASRDDLMELAQEKGTQCLLETLTDHIPVNKNLPEVKRMKAIGFNATRAEEIMNRHDLDLLIVTSPVNVFYMSGLPVLHAAPNPILFALSNQYPNVAMVRRDAAITLFNWDLFRSVDRFCWVADHKGTIGQKDVRRAMWSKIKKWGLVGKRIGVESTAPKYLLDHLARKNPDSEIVVADEAILDMRLVKSDEEVRRIEEATRITENAIMACVEAARPGMTDNDFLKIARTSFIESGAEGWDHLTLSIGDSDPEAPGIGTAAKEGDILRFDFGAMYEGYVSDVNRHVVLGPVPADAAELIERLIQFQEYYEQRVKPGVNIRELNEQAIAYYKTIKPDGMTFAVGHSIGLECEETHLFGTMGLYDRPFEKNMVFEIEAWEPFGGTLIGVEDCYVVTDDGCRKITTLDKHMIEKR